MLSFVEEVHTANNSWWFLSTFLVKGCAGGTFCLYYQYISNAWTVSWALDLKDYWYKEDSANRDQTPIKCLGIFNNFFMVSNVKKPWYICQKKRCCSHNLLVVSTVTNSSEICNVSAQKNSLQCQQNFLGFTSRSCMILSLFKFPAFFGKTNNHKNQSSLKNFR